MVERRKGVTWNENLIFKTNLISQNVSIPAASNILLDYTVKSGLVYTATQNRSQAQSRETELSNVTDFYVDWIWYFCGQERTITAYSPSIDGDDVVIGRFTLESSFDTEPATGANIRLINPDDIAEVDQIVMKLSPGGQVQIGGDNNVGVIHNNDDGFVKYRVTDETLQAFPLIAKPEKDDSINVATFCTIFSTIAASQDPFIEKFGIFLDSVPANTKARIYLLSTDELNPRYPVLENVTLDEFNQGNGDAVIESTYEIDDTWNLLQMSNPGIIRGEENFVLFGAFSDENGNPRTVPVPVDTSATDAGSFFTVRSDNIQSASGTAITLDANASPRDDDYNGMRLYIDGEFRDILDYNGTTKVATVASSYTSEPDPNDAYDIKIAFISPMMIFEYKNAIKGQIQDKHNTRELSFSDTGDELEIGTFNYVDTTGGAPTFTVPAQSFEFLGAWFEIIDKEGNFDTNPVTIDFNEADFFEGDADTDFICNEKGVRYRFRYIDDDFGWTVEKFNVKTYGEMYQSGSNTITIDVKDTWYEIDGMSEGETNNVTFQSAKELKITRAGQYSINYGVCWTNGVLTAYKFRLAINGTTQAKSQSCGKKANAADIVNSSSTSILDLAVDDVITLEVLNATNTNDIDILDANVSIHKIEGNS